MQPSVNKQDAVRIRNDFAEQFNQALLIASNVNKSEPIKNRKLPKIV